jgi:hypothetical protein
MVSFTRVGVSCSTTVFKVASPEKKGPHLLKERAGLLCPKDF